MIRPSVMKSRVSSYQGRRAIACVRAISRLVDHGEPLARRTRRAHVGEEPGLRKQVDLGFGARARDSRVEKLLLRCARSAS